MGYVLETVLGMQSLIESGVYTLQQAEQLLSDTEKLALYLIRSGDDLEESRIMTIVTSDSYGPDTRSVCATYAAFKRDYPLTQKICDLVVPQMPLDGNHLIEMGMDPGPGIGRVLTEARGMFLTDYSNGVQIDTAEYIQGFRQRVRNLIA